MMRSLRRSLTGRSAWIGVAALAFVAASSTAAFAYIKATPTVSGRAKSGKLATPSITAGSTKCTTPSSSTHVTLSWTAVANATTYVISRTTGGGYTTTATVAGTSTTYTLSSAGTYHFKVRATLHTWTSPTSSNTATFTIASTPVCSES